VSLSNSAYTTFGALLRDLAAKHGERAGIWFEQREYTFEQIDAEVDGYAKGLLAAGVRHGDAVALLAGNRPEWLFVTMAAARVGAVCVPINTWYKAEEIGFLLSHTKPKMLFMVDSLLRQDYVEILEGVPDVRREGAADGVRTVALTLESRLAGAIRLEQFLLAGRVVGAGELRAAEAAVGPDDLLFILYTSGSTAGPKGVQLHHRPALMNDSNLGDRVGLQCDDRMALFIPLFYSAATVNAWPAAWTHATCLVLVDAFEPAAALSAIETARATAYFAVGSITRALVGHPEFRSFDTSMLTKGMTAFSEADKRLANVDLGITDCCAVYGLTESYGPFSITERGDPMEVHLKTSGRPLPGWSWKLIDPGTGEAVPDGEVGELWIKGYLTSGYFRNPAATEEVFDDQGFYCTGDLVRFDPEGRLVFHSRIKEVIKAKGVSLAPQDIEEVLLQHPGVSQAYVVGLPDEGSGEVVVAVVVASKATTEDELRGHVARRAASFKVPSKILFVDEAELPRTGTGKVPRFRVRSLAAERLSARAS